MTDLDYAEEYESAAEWCAKRGIGGNLGDPLPNNISGKTLENINMDPESFQQRIKDYAYAIAMNKLNLPEDY